MSIPPPSGPAQPQGSQEPYGPYAQGQYPPPPPGQYPPAPTAPYPYGAQPGPYPYGPYAPYGPYGRPTPVNGVAIGALVLGILCFLPAVGLVLGLIALVQIKKKGERGKGMAIAGSVLSSIGLTLWVVSLSTGFAADAWSGFKDAANGKGTAYALAKGDCFDSSTGSLEGEAYDVDEVPCSGRHDAEVFAVVTVPGTSFPGDDEVTRVAEEQCYPLQDSYAMDTWAVPDDVDVYYLVPTRQTWRFGDRAVTCLFGSREENGTLTGSLRSDYMTLNSYQVAFLSAGNAIDAALYEEPEEYPEENLTANHLWAKDVQRVLGDRIEGLRNHAWPQDAKGRIDAFIDDMEAARKEWGKAAVARDSDSFYVHYDKAYEYVDGPTTIAARKALELDTTRPKYEDALPGDGGKGGDGGGLDV